MKEQPTESNMTSAYASWNMIALVNHTIDAPPPSDHSSGVTFKKLQSLDLLNHKNIFRAFSS